jgi:hypothetical protein
MQDPSMIVKAVFIGCERENVLLKKYIISALQSLDLLLITHQSSVCTAYHRLETCSHRREHL